MNRVVRMARGDGARVTLLGGILGLDADAELARSEFARTRPAAVWLGVPFEDLDAVRATSGRETETEFNETEVDELYLERIRRFGDSHYPPADLYTLFALAQGAGVPVEAIDLADEAHTETYTRHVGLFEVIRSSRSQRRLASQSFEAATPEEFALRWDRALHPTKGLQRVQAERERWMADRIASLAQRGAPHLALLPLARLEGVRARLLSLAWREER